MQPIPLLILSHLREHGPQTGREIVSAMKGFRAEHIRAELWQMVRDGRIEVTREIKLAVPIGAMEA